MTEKHREILLEACSAKLFGSFCLTELGHGSNIRDMETTATYDPDTQEFVINSPTETSHKCWIGSLGKSACMAVVFARLITQGKDYGVHAFVINIRDRLTHLALPRLVIGECGPKNGFDGMDTGFIKFDNFRVHRDALLDRFGKVDEAGNYSSPIKSSGKRFANSIACLTTGRIFISRSSSEIATISCIIAIRYAFIRRQFGEAGKEKQLINYPMHQFRIFPRFCTGIVNYFSTLWVLDKWFKSLPNLLEEGNKDANLCHSLSSVVKIYTSWLGR